MSTTTDQQQHEDRDQRRPREPRNARLPVCDDDECGEQWARGRANVAANLEERLWSDSSSLTAGSAGSAAPGQRGATLAVHSTLGYAGGFLGPLVLGATLDLFGGMSALGWGLAFGHVTIALLLGALIFIWLRPADLAGDRSVTAATATAPLRRT